MFLSAPFFCRWKKDRLHSFCSENGLVVKTARKISTRNLFHQNDFLRSWIINIKDWFPCLKIRTFWRLNVLQWIQAIAFDAASVSERALGGTCYALSSIRCPVWTFVYNQPSANITVAVYSTSFEIHFRMRYSINSCN